MSKKENMIKCSYCNGKGKIPKPKYEYYKCPECGIKLPLLHAGIGCKGRVRCKKHGIFRPEYCERVI